MWRIIEIFFCKEIGNLYNTILVNKDGSKNWTFCFDAVWWDGESGQKWMKSKELRMKGIVYTFLEDTRYWVGDIKLISVDSSFSSYYREKKNFQQALLP